MKNFSIPFLLFVLLFAGCTTTPKDFKLAFTMESIKNYKLFVEINSDKSYHIKQQNLLFDAHAEKAHVNASDGTLSDEEFNELTGLITGKWLFKMGNTYGIKKNIDSSQDPFDGLFYHLSYTEGSKAKYILIHPTLSNDNPKKLSLLIKFFNDFSSKHLQN